MLGLYHCQQLPLETVLCLMELPTLGVLLLMPLGARWRFIAIWLSWMNSPRVPYQLYCQYLALQMELSGRCSYWNCNKAK